MDIKEQVILWTKSNLKSNFKFREHQLETIINIVSSAVNNLESNQIIEAPTGSGKSIIILVSAGVLSDYYCKKSYILCSDLSLWDQYYKFIKQNNLDFGYLKGQTKNYACFLNGNPVRCGECKIRGKSWSHLMTKNNIEFPCAKKCQYIKDRKRACLKNVTLMTYQCYLYTLMHQESINAEEFSLSPSPREIIFCDECHHIPDVVMTQFNPRISLTDIDLADSVYTFLEKEGIITLPYKSSIFKNNLIKLHNELKNTELSGEQDLKLVTDYYNQYNILWEGVKEQQEYYTENYSFLKKSLKIKVAEMYKSFENVIIYGDQFRDLISYLPSSDFLIKEVNGEVLNFYNLKQDFLVYKCLLSKANHRIMLSATVGDPAVFADNIGLKYLENKEYTFNRVPSLFNFEKSPILIYANYKLNWKNKDILFPKIQNIIYEICNNFSNQKGIIQTTSYADALSIYENAPQKIKMRLLVYNNSVEKSSILKEHINKEDSILLGPTLNEGLDLPDDLCRFIIITKIPYPQLNSKFLKKKIELFKGWYESTTSLKLIQAIGRGVRNETDYCNTFILDACFFDLFNKTKTQYSQELVSRFIVEAN